MPSFPTESPAQDRALSGAISHALKRLGPFLMLMFVVSFLDRANVGYAKQALAASVGISERAYALGAGLFFIGYSLCGFPSNLILHRIGAKIWIALLMVGWGIVSMATMFVRGATSFYLLRLLLGVMEAGFFPGIIYYLTLWFPSRVRGHILGIFYLGVPLAMIVGGPLSGWLLELPAGTGLEGWQCMFLVEGFFAVALGLLAYAYLDDRPNCAQWLPHDEKRALEEELGREEQQRRSSGPAEVLPMLRDRRVLRFLLIYFLIQMSTYGAVFYLPAEVSALLHQPVGITVGLVSSVPWICALAAVYLLPKAADRLRNHRQMAALILLAAGCASLVFPTAAPIPALAALSIAVSGFIAVQPVFWTLPTGYLVDRAAAGGIALIGMGNLGGFLAPNVKVWADEYFASPRAGLYVLAGIALLNAWIVATTKQATTKPATTKQAGKKQV
jgi:MFS family permease